MGHWLIYLGSAVVVIWGIAHIVPTRAVVAGFGPLSADNRRIISMEWVAEGLALTFIGVLMLVVALFAQPSDATAVLVLRLSAAMLVVMAAWTAIAGFATSIVPIKLCPFVLTAAAAAIAAGTLY